MYLIKKYKYHLTIILLIILIILFIYIKQQLNKEKYQDIEPIVTENIKTETIKEESTCIVDIKGAVNNPGVYQISCDKTVNDAIKIAGDLTEEANTSIINLAKKITNEMVIIVYTNEEVANSNIVNNVVKVVEKECICPNIQNDGCLNNKITDEISNIENNGLININTATLEEIKSIPGIGESKAKAIIEYRNEHGNFDKIEDIQNVSGIGTKLYEEIKIYITT